MAFKQYSIFENNKTKLNKIFLRDVYYTYIYPENENKPILHHHIIWCSPFFIKQMQNAIHMYIDGAYIFPNGFKQTIIILFYDIITKSRYPGAFILLNNKLYQGYLIAFNAFNNIIIKYNSIKIKLETISIDFEDALINALQIIFPKVKLIGCFFHYMFNLDKTARKYGLYKFNNNEVRYIIKELGAIPFIYTDDNKIINKTFDILKEKYKFDEGILNLLNNYESYYRYQWIRYIENGMLNYHNIDKFRRSNSYIENYNRHLKNKLKPFIYKNKNSKIDWIFFQDF